MLEGSGVQPKKSLKKQDLIDLLMSNHHDDICNRNRTTWYWRN